MYKQFIRYNGTEGVYMDFGYFITDKIKAALEGENT